MSRQNRNPLLKVPNSKSQTPFRDPPGRYTKQKKIENSSLNHPMQTQETEREQTRFEEFRDLLMEESDANTKP